jgi:hypothetical protein
MKRIMVAMLAVMLLVGFNAAAFAGDAPKGGDTKTEKKDDKKGGDKKGK